MRVSLRSADTSPQTTPPYPAIKGDHLLGHDFKWTERKSQSKVVSLRFSAKQWEGRLVPTSVENLLL